MNGGTLRKVFALGWENLGKLRWLVDAHLPRRTQAHEEAGVAQK